MGQQLLPKLLDASLEGLDDDLLGGGGAEPGKAPGQLVFELLGLADAVLEHAERVLKLDPALVSQLLGQPIDRCQLIGIEGRQDQQPDVAQETRQSEHRLTCPSPGFSSPRCRRPPDTSCWCRTSETRPCWPGLRPSGLTGCPDVRRPRSSPSFRPL